MAPEQVNESLGRITVRTDVHGIGAVLYTLLTGKPPWAEDMAEVQGLREMRPDVSVSVAEICHRCLAVNPEYRFASVAELRAALLMSGAMAE